MERASCQFCDAYLTPEGVCESCADLAKFAAFAKTCGLTRFPDPSGERYVYRLDGRLAGKKSECPDFMEELWDALVRAKGGGGDLILHNK